MTLVPTPSETAVIPMLLALLAASLFGAQAVLARRSLRFVRPQVGAMVSIVVSSVVFWAIYVWQLEWAHWHSPAVWVFASNGLLHPVISMFLSFEANRRMGATVSATVAATTPLFAAAGAVLGLGESITVPILLGTFGIVGGVVALSWSGEAARGWPLSALVFPTGASLVRAFNHVWGRFGLLILPLPIMAATLSFTVSSVLAVAVYRVREGRYPLRIPLGGLLWGGASGVVVCGAILSMYTALTTGTVVVVSPIINTYPLFTLFWSLLFREESLSTRIAIGVVLVVGGVTLIGLR